MNDRHINYLYAPRDLLLSITLPNILSRTFFHALMQNRIRHDLLGWDLLRHEEPFMDDLHILFHEPGAAWSGAKEMQEDGDTYGWSRQR